TGTLTQNAMTLGEIIPLDQDEAAVREVLAQLVSADPAPNASMMAIAEAVPAAAQAWDVAARAPFTSAKKWSGVSFSAHGHWVLGAPDVLATADVAAQAEEIGATGRRVLLLGTASQPVDSPAAPGEVVPAALLVLDQLVRPDAADTLAYFNDQNVAVKVISGDNAASVGAVTRSLGVSVADAVDARHLPTDEAEFAEVVGKTDVFGRVTPQQKRAMVTALQSQGQTVAMTGDGVNDVLALKDADLGVAMGSGSAATRAVAQIVLLDDRFATLPHVVAEGRRVIGNIERVAKLFLTKTVYAVLIALVVGLLGLPNPFIPLHVTVTGWFTIGIPAFLLSLAPNKERARPGFVSRVLALALPSGIVVGLVAIVTYVATRGFGEVSATIQAQASTATLAALIITVTWVLAVVARPWVTWRLGLVVFAYAFYAAMFLLPWSRQLLSLDLTNAGTMLFGLIAGLVGAACIEATWWLTAARRGEPAHVWRRPQD
ncbi:MAG: HAD-IC family P-type ATPase, partial [Propionibacteriaceae bacterium]|nr:HAD-IC family P-type ATPase [Propionibacteriaceae bacterium]